jgi:hypothetical protein
MRSRSDVSADWSRQSPPRKAAHIAAGLMDLRTSSAAMRFAIRSNLRGRESLFRLGRMLAKREWIRTQHRSTIFDQGFLQDLWSVLYAGGQCQPASQLLAPLISNLYRDMDVRILWIEIDVAAAAERITGRTQGDSRLDRLTVAQVTDRLERSARIPAAIKQAAIDAGLTVHSLNGGASVAALVAHARALLNHPENR